MPKRKNTEAVLGDPKLDDHEVIASREYFTPRLMPPMPVVVRLAAPRLKADGKYECGIEINESGQVWVRRLIGEDAIESLSLALIMMGTVLNHINGQLDGALVWGSEQRYDLGLPVPPLCSLYSVLNPPQKIPFSLKKKKD